MVRPLLLLALSACAPAPPSVPKKAPSATCLDVAVLANAPPPASAWHRAGHVRLLAKDGSLSSAIAEDANGKEIATYAILAPAEAHRAIVSAICATGAVGASAVAGSDDGGAERFDFETYAPSREDERGDLDAICSTPETGEPATPFGGLEVAHRRLIWLTSTRWRTWMRSTEKSILEADDEASAKQIARNKARELDGLSQRNACGYVAILQRFGGEEPRRD